MTKAELEAKIKKAKENKFMPDALKAKYIADIEKQIASLGSAPAEEKPKKEKKAKAPKPKKEKPKKEPRTITVDGKVITEGDADYCKRVIEAWNVKKQKHKESAAKSAAKPDSVKNSDKIEHVEENVMERAKSGKIKRAELLKLIKETKELLAVLTEALKKIGTEKMAKGGKVSSDPVKPLYDKAVKLFNDHINNGGKSDYSEKEYNYLSDLLDEVDIGYFKKSPDGTHQEELEENGFTLTSKEAKSYLENRISSIEAELKGQMKKGGKIKKIGYRAYKQSKNK